MDGIIGNPGGTPGDDVAAAGDRQRDSLFLVATLRLPDEPHPRDVRIRNLSERGVMVEVGRDVAIGTTTRIAVRGIGEIAGHVVWSVDDRIGISLDRAIDPRRARKPVGGATAKAPPPR